jgi:hypothetical protein
MSNFRKHKSGFIQLNVDGTHLIVPTAVAYAFAKHFQSFYSKCCSKDFPAAPHLSESFPLLLFLMQMSAKPSRLKLLKYVGLDHIPGFTIKGYSGLIIPILRHIFNLSLTQQYFLAAWKEAAVVPVLKRCSHAPVNNYRPIYIFNIFSKLFEFIIHDHVSHYAKCNHGENGFTGTKSKVTNLVTFPDFLTPVVRGQHQADAMYFDVLNFRS